MKTQQKKLNLKKTTIIVLGKKTRQELQTGAGQATRPLFSCRVVCVVSIQNICITQSEVC
jgi:hypothetical protein